MDLIEMLESDLAKGRSLKWVVDFWKARQHEIETGEIQGGERLDFSHIETWLNLQNQIDSLRKEQKKIEAVSQQLKPGEQILKFGCFVTPPKVKRVKKFQIRLL